MSVVQPGLFVGEVQFVPVPITLMYVILGLLLAAMATYLQATRSLVLSNLKGEEQSALTIAYDKFKLQTVYPVVGLYVVAVICAVGLPGYYAWQLNHGVDETPIELKIPMVPVDRSSVTLTLPESKFQQLVRVPVYRSSSSFEYTIANDEVEPVTVSVRYDRRSGCLQVSFPADTSRKPVCLKDIKDNAATMDPPLSLVLSKKRAAASIDSHLPQPKTAVGHVPDPVNL